MNLPQKLTVIDNVTGDPMPRGATMTKRSKELVSILRELADDVERRGVTEYHVTCVPEYHVDVDESGFRTHTPGAGESISLELRWATPPHGL